MSDQDQPFTAPGFDANLHACATCLDTGISQEDSSYCTACSMGKRIEQLDNFAAQLKGHGFTEAMRIVFRSTQHTEKAIAAAEKALLIAEHKKAIVALEAECNHYHSLIATPSQPQQEAVPAEQSEQDKLTRMQAVILTGFTGVMCVNSFSDFYADVSNRMKRPVWTHEFPALREEIKELYRADFLAMLPAARQGGQHG